MTFEKDDINHALEILKHTIHISASQRRKDTGWLDSITNWVKGTTLDDLKQMTVVQRHAVNIHI
jgi:hypothetical protein